MPEYTQFKKPKQTEYRRRAVLIFNIKSFLSTEERKKQSFCRATLNWKKLRNKCTELEVFFTKQ